MNCIETKVFRFFDEHLDQSRPILLGLSGGPDSRCLLHLFLKWQTKHPMSLHLAHVDHGWRKESQEELDCLAKMAKELSLPFHVAKLDPSIYKGNLEAESREERLSFFDTVIQKTQSQAVMLGHHADDLAETVFKRILEGAGLPFLSGMSAKANIANVPILRPLLHVSKNEIFDWLHAQGISYFQDPTNSDERFLRARMRETIFPDLRTSFGKEFEANLCSIASEAELLRHHLNEKVQPILSQMLTGPFGSYIDLSGSRLTKFELLYMLRVVTLGASFSRVQLHAACDFLLNRVANKQIMTKNALLFCDRGRAFFMPREHMKKEEAIELKEGTHTFGKWHVTVYCGATECKNHFTDLWRGMLQTVVKKGAYTLTYAPSGMFRFVHESKIIPLGRYLSETKTPHFLMNFVPVVCNNEHIVEDFVTGTQCNSKKNCSNYLVINLKFKNNL